MLDLRSFDSLGRFKNEWLNARHHFSFSDYYDPSRMGWGPLRVWNDDTIRAKSGFPPHGHRDMEIITYVREGAVSHRDSFGNQGATTAGEVQVMSAGNGIQHSEMNLGDEDLLLFQIWIEPNARGLKPRWEARQFPAASASNLLVPLASGRGIADTIEIAQDATLFAGNLGAGAEVTHDLGTDRLGYLVTTKGRLRIADAKGDMEIGPRDGVAIADLAKISITALDDTSFVLADLPR